MWTFSAIEGFSFFLKLFRTELKLDLKNKFSSQLNAAKTRSGSSSDSAKHNLWFTDKSFKSYKGFPALFLFYFVHDCTKRKKPLYNQNKSS